MPPDPPSGMRPRASQTMAVPSKISLFVNESTYELWNLFQYLPLMLLILLPVCVICYWLPLLKGSVPPCKLKYNANTRVPLGRHPSYPLSCPGVGNKEKKCQIPGVQPTGIVTCGIEPRITQRGCSVGWQYQPQFRSIRQTARLLW